MVKTAKVKERVIRELKNLKQHPKNPKKHSQFQVEKLGNAIEKEGYNQEIVIDENDQVLKGWGRVLALIDRGYEEAECVLIRGLSEDEKIQMIIRDNKVVSQEWDTKILIAELPRLEGLGMETGFAENEIRDLQLSIKDDVNDEQSTFELSPHLYEKYNYVMLFFKNDIDFVHACQTLGVKKKTDVMKPTKVGLYRAVDGSEAIRKLLAKKK